MKKILTALEALCRAWPDVAGIGVDIRPHGAHFTIKTATDQGVRDLADEYGLTIHSHANDGSEWIAAYGSAAIGSFSVFGPQRPITHPTAANPDAVAAALALADAAVP